MADTETEKTRQAVEGYFDAIMSVDAAGIEKALGFMTDDIVWENPGSIKQGGIFRGKAEVRKLLIDAIAEVYEPGTFQNVGRRTIAEGNRAVTIYDGASRTKNGRDYRQHYVIEFEVNPEGKLIFIRENFDTLHFHNTVYAD